MREKKIEGISDLAQRILRARGLRVVIELKRTRCPTLS